MVVAIIGSRSLDIPIPEGIIPENATYIISGGAKGMDLRAREYAYRHRIVIEEIVPAYNIYGRRAPLIRNDIIISRSDAVFIFWDGKSRGASYVIRECRRQNKLCRVYVTDQGSFRELTV